jgi:hypothetical protein
MLVTTYSEARRTFAAVLDRAKEEGAVLIKRADGSLFRLVPELSGASPFDGIETPFTLPEGAFEKLLEDLREESGHRFFG